MSDSEATQQQAQPAGEEPTEVAESTEPAEETQEVVEKKEEEEVGGGETQGEGEEDGGAHGEEGEGEPPKAESSGEKPAESSEEKPAESSEEKPAESNEEKPLEEAPQEAVAQQPLEREEETTEGEDKGAAEGVATGGEEAPKPEEGGEKPEEGAKASEVAAAEGGGDEEEPKKKEVEEPRKPRFLPRTKVRSVRPGEGVDLAMGESGLEADEPITVGQMFQETVSKLPDHAALKYKVDGEWKSSTFTEYYKSCTRAAKSFLKLGLEQYNSVAIIGFNSPEWVISNLGAMFAGGLAAGIYTTNSPEAIFFIADNCKANVLVVENEVQLLKVLQIRDRLPSLKAVIQYKGQINEDHKDEPNLYDWETFMKLGDDMEDSVVEEIVKAQRPEHCALLVYTSGTTGNPKGVMLSHDNLTWTSKSLRDSYAQIVFGEERGVSYLPLSHIAAQTTDIYLAILGGATVYFAQPDALKGTLGQTLQDAQPTIFFGVPRVYEKMMESIQGRQETLKGFKKRVSRWSMKKGLKGNRRREEQKMRDRSASMPMGWGVANKLVFKKVKDALGMGHARILAVGAAPTRREVHEFFMSLDLPLMELYGMSESSGPQTMNFLRPETWKVCSCGKTIVGVGMKIDNPDEDGNGEICYYGRHIFMGYLNDEQKTKEALDDEGWLHSGDIGKLDESGFLSITGRIKELIITSGGENIPPVLIEDEIKKEVPFISNVMVIGDQRKFLTCLITLKCEMNPDTAEPTDKLTAQAQNAIDLLGSHCKSISQIVQEQDKAVFTAIQEGLDRANGRATSRAQKVQKWTLLSSDFSIPGGELGPTLKLRRPVVVKKYAETIESLYDDTFVQSMYS